mmetsp:Transcript_33995/g.108073  ORF Transcript_33995/g.108073 Transcript_33995/m.108073 type:complete len:200 (+) Transcript_33995:3-602(+)
MVPKGRVSNGLIPQDWNEPFLQARDWALQAGAKLHPASVLATCRILPRENVPAMGLVVEGAVVVLGMPMCGAVVIATLALEARKANLLPAKVAPRDILLAAQLAFRLLPPTCLLLQGSLLLPPLCLLPALLEHAVLLDNLLPEADRTQAISLQPPRVHTAVETGRASKERRGLQLPPLHGPLKLLLPDLCLLGARGSPH